MPSPDTLRPDETPRRDENYEADSAGRKAKGGSWGAACINSADAKWRQVHKYDGRAFLNAQADDFSERYRCGCTERAVLRSYVADWTVIIASDEAKGDALVCQFPLDMMASVCQFDRAVQQQKQHRHKAGHCCD